MRATTEDLVARLREVRDDLAGMARHNATCRECASEPYVRTRIMAARKERDLLNAVLVERGHFPE